MSFSTRLSAVEKLLISERIALVMRDGTRKYIPGDGEILVHWFCLAMRWVYHQRHGGPRPVLEFPQELGWIRDSIEDDEQGGHLVSAIRAFLFVGWGRKPKQEVKR